MRILFLCNKSPWPPREGGPMAMNMLISGLTERGHKVKVLAVNSYKYNITADSIPDEYKKRTGIEFVDVDLRIRPVNALRDLVLGRSYHISRFISARLEKKLAGILKSETFDVVQLETLYMCPYIPVIRRCSNARIVLRSHNVEHLIWKRIGEGEANPLKKWYLLKLAGALKKYEEQAVMNVDGIVAITGQDAAFFSKITGHEEYVRNQPKHGAKRKRPFITDIPFGTGTGIFPQGVTEEYPSLFSIGSMNWIPNQEGIRWFLDKVWPDIRLNFPELKYYLAGREMPAWMKNLDIPNVVVLGEVEDAARFMAEKSVMIVPLFSGSGIRVKIIEGMAAGKAIISTTIGAEGIECQHLQHILIADTPCEFFEMVSICVTDRAACDRIGSSARELIRENYHPATLTGRLEAFYREIGV